MFDRKSPQHRAALFRGILLLTVQVAVVGVSFIQLAFLRLGTAPCAAECRDPLASWGTGYQWWAVALVVAGTAWLVAASRRGWPALTGPVVTIALTLAGWAVVNGAMATALYG